MGPPEPDGSSQTSVPPSDRNFIRRRAGLTPPLCSGEEILATAEDVGRLNTLDKVFGWAVLQDIDLERCYAVTSGRITGRTVDKASKFGVPIVASKGAVTTLAVEMAEEMGMTLVGFARQGRMNVYAGRYRVTL